jgi:hypothetical protein
MRYTLICVCHREMNLKEAKIRKQIIAQTANIEGKGHDKHRSRTFHCFNSHILWYTQEPQLT